MSDVSGLGAYGIYPFLSDDVIKQAKFGRIPNKAGKLAYIMSLGDKAQKPRVEDGVEEARGALKWIKKFAEET